MQVSTDSRPPAVSTISEQVGGEAQSSSNTGKSLHSRPSYESQPYDSSKSGAPMTKLTMPQANANGSVNVTLEPATPQVED